MMPATVTAHALASHEASTLIESVAAEWRSTALVIAPPKNPGFLTQIRTRLCERVHCFALFSELDYCARRSRAVGCCTIGTKTILENDNEYQETA
jgi:hypothetical protein